MEETKELLKSVGKNTFLLFYPILKENQNITVEEIKSKVDQKYQRLWSSDSWNTKLSKAKTIFKLGATSDALYLCAISAKRWSYLDDK